MDLRKIESVCAVAAQHSYNEAAYLTNVSPSVISKHVAAVEAELGIRLFRRATRAAAVELTAEGEAVIGHLQELLHQYRLAQQAADNARGAQKAMLRVGYVQQMGSFRENSILAGFTIAHPAVLVQRRSFSVQELPAQLINGSVDAIFLPLPDGTDIASNILARLREEGCTVTEIMHIDRLSLGVPPGNCFYLRDCIPEAEFAKLAGETFLFPLSEMDEALLSPVVARKLGLQEQMRLRYTDFSEKIMPCNIAVTDGCLLPQLCLVPKTMSELHFVPVEGHCPGITLYLVHRTSADCDALRRLDRYVLSASPKLYEEFPFVTTPKR